MKPKNHHGHTHADMLSVEEARDKILDSFISLGTEELPVIEALGLTLSEDIHSPINIPPFNNSAMDGYALKSENIKEASYDNPIHLKVAGTISAGEVPNFQVTDGHCARIMTGAPMPDGADAVVPFEETTEMDKDSFSKSKNKIGIKISVSVGNDVRKSGKDVATGDLILKKGTHIKPSTIGLISSIGKSKVPIHRRPQVAILSTGNELLNPGDNPVPGKIFDSNTNAIIASVIEAGGTPKSLGIIKDDIESLNYAISLAKNSDIVITSAGVSKGDYDMVKDVLSSQGELNFWSVRMRPAKPLAFGMLDSGTPLIGLPGNPVSALVAFEQFCRPAIRKMLGKKYTPRPVIKAVLQDSIQNYDSRRVYARVKVWQENNKYLAETSGSQGSNILSSLAYANGLAICPENEKSKNCGDNVDVIMIDWPEEMFNDN
ncbi:MAG: gephyrin-like molybdotransferase Glp [Dehalococcoidia bacterium]